jgi:hypothetical protein
VAEVNLNLEGNAGTGNSDGPVDHVTVNGTSGNDAITVQPRTWQCFGARPGCTRQCHQSDGR